MYQDILGVYLNPMKNVKVNIFVYIKVIALLSLLPLSLSNNTFCVCLFLFVLQICCGSCETVLSRDGYC